MKIQVYSHEITIEQPPINEKEINITKCEFEFSLEITDDFIKEAYFTLNGYTYKQIIVNNECDIPSEVLVEKGEVELGVVAKLVDLSDNTIKQYNPSPCYFNTWKGSLKQAQNSQPITPSDKEQMEQQIQNVTNQMNNLDIDAEKVDHTTTITITKKDGSQKTTEVDDGIDGTGLDYNWSGTSLGIKREDETNYNYVNLQGPVGPAGAIRMTIVNELPLTGEDGTLYFVPKTPDTSDLYDEYVWINNAWELLGEKQIIVDLSDYYTKQETYSQSEVNTLLSGKQNTIDSSHKLSADLVDDTSSTNKFVSASDITSWNDKLDSTKVKNTNSTTAGDVYDVRYINTLIGDIDTALDLLNGEVIL